MDNNDNDIIQLFSMMVNVYLWGFVLISVFDLIMCKRPFNCRIVFNMFNKDIYLFTSLYYIYCQVSIGSCYFCTSGSLPFLCCCVFYFYFLALFLSCTFTFFGYTVCSFHTFSVCVSCATSGLEKGPQLSW